jgi:hypothetical protein
MQKGVILGCGNRSNAGMDTVTLSQQVHNKNEVKETITVVKRADRVVQGVKAANGFLQSLSSPLGDALLALGAGENGVVLRMNTVKRGENLQRFHYCDEVVQKQPDGNDWGGRRNGN